MTRRRRISRRGSKKLFSRTAMRTRSKNLRTSPMRGGFRIQLERARTCYGRATSRFEFCSVR